MRACLVAFALLVALPTVAPAAPSVRFTPHRAVYDLSLAKGGGPRGVESARGRIVMEFTGDACEGYASKFRQVTVLESSETGSRTSDMRNVSFEDADGKSLRFKSESLTNGARREVVDGDAQQNADGSVAVRLKEPKRDRFVIGDAPLFPTEHLRRLIEAALAGETTVSVKVYDGSEGGRKVYDTLSIIGRRIEPGAGEGIEAASRQEGLAKLARWPMTLSYYAPGEGERTPVYVLSFDLYENGIARALRLDYGAFALKGELVSLDVLPESACQR